MSSVSEMLRINIRENDWAGCGPGSKMLRNAEDESEKILISRGGEEEGYGYWRMCLLAVANASISAS